MESKYHYFKRDISWLSFNHRVLLEADDDSLPLYERINFVSIYSSNLEEFYKIRVAEHKAIASGGHSDDITQEEAKHLIHQITEVVNEQMEDRIRIYERKLIPALREQQHVVFFHSKQEVEPVHTEFIRKLDAMDLEKMDAQQQAALLEMLDFLAHWLQHHIKGMDCRIGK